MRSLSLLSVVLVGACLSSPSPVDRDASVIDGAVGPDGLESDIDGGPADADSDAGPCQAGPSGAGTAFPPAGLTVRTATTADMNGDCRTDIAVGATAAASGDQGVYILLGRAAADGSAYDAFLPTGDVDPMAVGVRDLDGNGLADVVVLGPGASTKAVLMLFMATGPTSFASSQSINLGGPDMPADRRAYLAFGNLDGDEHVDILMGRYLSIQHVDVSAFDVDFQTLAVQTLPEPSVNGWGETEIGYFGQGQTQGQDDVWIQQPSQTYRYPNDGGAPASTYDLEIFNNDGDYDMDESDDIPGMRSVFVTEMNGDGIPDIIGNGDNDVRLVLMDPNPMSINPYMFHLNDNMFIDTSDHDIDHIRLVDVDDQSTPSLLLANSLEPDLGISHLTQYIGARLQPTTPRFTATFKQKVSLDTDVHPYALATGDFDGDGITQAIVLSGDGTAYCFDVRAGSGLTACN